MIIISFNVRGAGGNPKYFSLKIIFKGSKLDIILVYETMVVDSKSKEVFINLLPCWEWCSMDAVGNMGVHYQLGNILFLF